MMIRQSNTTDTTAKTFWVFGESLFCHGFSMSWSYVVVCGRTVVVVEVQETVCDGASFIYPRPSPKRGGVQVLTRKVTCRTVLAGRTAGRTAEG